MCASHLHLVSTPCLHAWSATLRLHTSSLRFVESEREGGWWCRWSGAVGSVDTVVHKPRWGSKGVDGGRRGSGAWEVSTKARQHRSRAKPSWQCWSVAVWGRHSCLHSATCADRNVRATLGAAPAKARQHRATSPVLRSLGYGAAATRQYRQARQYRGSRTMTRTRKRPALCPAPPGHSRGDGSPCSPTGTALDKA